MKSRIYYAMPQQSYWNQKPVSANKNSSPSASLFFFNTNNFDFFFGSSLTSSNTSYYNNFNFIQPQDFSFNFYSQPTVMLPEISQLPISIDWFTIPNNTNSSNTTAPKNEPQESIRKIYEDGKLVSVTIDSNLINIPEDSRLREIDNGYMLINGDGSVTLYDKKGNDLTEQIEQLRAEYEAKLSNRILMLTYNYDAAHNTAMTEPLTYYAITDLNNNEKFIGKFRFVLPDGRVAVPSADDIPQTIPNGTEYVVMPELADTEKFQNKLREGSLLMQKYNTDRDGSNGRWENREWSTSGLIADKLYTDDDADAEVEFNTKLNELGINYSQILSKSELEDNIASLLVDLIAINSQISAISEINLTTNALFISEHLQIFKTHDKSRLEQFKAEYQNRYGEYSDDIVRLQCKTKLEERIEKTRASITLINRDIEVCSHSLSPDEAYLYSLEVEKQMFEFEFNNLTSQLNLLSGNNN